MGRGLTAGFSARPRTQRGWSCWLPFSLSLSLTRSLTPHALSHTHTHTHTQAADSTSKHRFSTSLSLSFSWSILSHILSTHLYPIAFLDDNNPVPDCFISDFNFDQLIARFIPLNISSLLSPWLHEQDLEHIVKRERCNMIMGRLLLLLLLRQ